MTLKENCTCIRIANFTWRSLKRKCNQNSFQSQTKSARLRLNCGMFQMKSNKKNTIGFVLYWMESKVDISLKPRTTKFHFSEWFYVISYWCKLFSISLQQSISMKYFCLLPFWWNKNFSINLTVCVLSATTLKHMNRYLLFSH